MTQPNDRDHTIILNNLALPFRKWSRRQQNGSRTAARSTPESSWKSAATSGDENPGQRAEAGGAANVESKSTGSTPQAHS